MGLPVPGSPAPRKGPREMAKERGQWGEGAKLQSKLFSHRCFNADSSHVPPLLCSPRWDRGGHVPTNSIEDICACLLFNIAIKCIK